MSRFARDTAAVESGPGIFDVRIDRGWWIERGPNGGYVGAVILRAMTAAADVHTVRARQADPSGPRPARSFTVHYLAPPEEGPAQVHTTIERAGRSLTSVSARLVQGERQLAIAVGAFSSSRPSVEFCDLAMPDVPPPEILPARERSGPPIAMAERYEQRWAVGHDPIFDLSPAGEPLHAVDRDAREALAGGWIRLAEPEVVDAHVLVAYADAWVPPIFSKVGRAMAVPTVDLTVHLRSPAPEPAGAWCLVAFRSTTASDGFLEESGEIWSRDGRLLAQSRQLAVMLPFTP